MSWTAESATDRVLLRDGRPATVRLLDLDDLVHVAALHAALSAADVRHRFLTGCCPDPERVARSMLRPPARAIGMVEAGALIGVAHYVPVPDGAVAEFAVVVASSAQGRGAGTLLMEALLERAAAEGVAVLVAETTADNAAVAALLNGLGRPVHLAPEGPVTHVRILLGDWPSSSVGVYWTRAAAAAAVSLLPVLAPRSVVVVGASRRPGTVGRAVIERIRAGGFTGTLAAVNPHGRPVPGIGWERSVSALAGPIDLAVLCVPPGQVVAVAQECGQAGAEALLVISAGVQGDAARDLLEVAGRFGMRLVGPNCLGVVNSDPAVALDASFAPIARAGQVGVAAQSGGVAAAVGAALGRAGLGTSSVISIGDGLDVAAEDVLGWWLHDGRTKGAVLYLESTRRPRQFAAIAQQVARQMPLVIIGAGRSAAGRRAAASHTATTATPRAAREALYRQAGLLVVDDSDRAAAVLGTLLRARLPAGPRVGIVSNAGGLGVLAADACAAAGLEIASLDAGSRYVLADLLPATAETTGPVDTTATATGEVVARVTGVVAADPGVDAVLVIGVPTDLGDPLVGLDALAGGPVPILVVTSGASVRELPVHADAASAAAALVAGLHRHRWLRRVAEGPSVPERTDAVRARVAVAGRSGWLDAGAVQELLAAAGIRYAPVYRVHGGDEAVARRRALGRPVALKADAAGLLHKSREGGVLLALDSEAAVRDGVELLARRFGPRLAGVLVQPMAPPGVEVLVGMTLDEVVGPMVTLGRGGTATDLLGDRRRHLLVPAGASEAADALEQAGLGAAVLGPAFAEVQDVVTRWGWLATTVPGLVEAEINPLVVGTDGAVIAVDARVRLANPDDA